VGETTFGKGVVQTTYPIYDGSALKLTTAKYYTPNGVCIDGVGITPDYEVESNKDYRLPIITNNEAGYNLEMDNQLRKAVEVITN
ncbi:MAG: S41 family peptidase, partial [Lachnospirales bacterium]